MSIQDSIGIEQIQTQLTTTSSNSTSSNSNVSFENGKLCLSLKFNDLAFEVILNILKHSSVRSIARLAKTNGHFRQICSSNQIRSLVFKKLGAGVPIKHIGPDTPVCPGSIFKRTADTYILPYKSKYVVECFGQKKDVGLVGAKVRRIRYIYDNNAYCSLNYEIVKHMCQDGQPCFCQNDWKFTSNENKVVFMVDSD